MSGNEETLSIIAARNPIKRNEIDTRERERGKCVKTGVVPAVILKDEIACLTRLHIFTRIRYIIIYIARYIFNTVLLFASKGSIK